MIDQTAIARAGGSNAAASRIAAIAPAFLAAFLGVFLIWGVGFAQDAVLHNAAHDTRHSYGFPCH